VLEDLPIADLRRLASKTAAIHTSWSSATPTVQNVTHFNIPSFGAQHTCIIHGTGLMLVFCELVDTIVVNCWNLNSGVLVAPQMSWNYDLMWNSNKDQLPWFSMPGECSYGIVLGNHRGPK
jgi:hypothetical protein